MTTPTPTAWTGERYRARNRVTGTLVVLVDAAEQGLDADGGKWALVCDEHATVLNHDTQAVLRSYLSAPWEWCADCLAIYEQRQAPRQ